MEKPTTTTELELISTSRKQQPQPSTLVIGSRLAVRGGIRVRTGIQVGAFEPNLVGPNLPPIAPYGS